jgi:signal transduction histidine kinase
MMQSFGGGIAIQSTPGSGTTVTLAFQAARTDRRSAQ